MYGAATEAFADSDVAILCAAVADFAAESVSPTKIKRGDDGLTLRLRPTHDIAAALGKMKRDGQRLVAFALETNDEDANARRKLERKNADFIVLNSTRNAGTTFGSDDNKVKIISRTDVHEYDKKPKTEVAADIINELERIL